MAIQALSAQTRPMSLVALTEHIQAAVEPQGWTAELVREGDALVVDLTGPICPDPLLAMIMLEAELGHIDTAGLEAIKLYGHCAGGEAANDPRTLASESPGWMSVIDLDGYFSRRAALSPEAFGLAGAEASRMACEAERDRSAAAPIKTEMAAPIALEAEPMREAEPQVPKRAAEESEYPRNSLVLEDPWEIELSGNRAVATPLPLEHFPHLSSSQVRPDDNALVAELASPLELLHLGQQTAEESVAAPVPAAGLRAVTVQQGIATASKPSQVQGGGQGGLQGGTQGAVDRPDYDVYRAFIADRSSWFAQTVKENPRLHELAQQRQHHALGTLSHYLVDTLAEKECLLDLVPVRKRDRGCGLIFTDQRVISLSQPSHRDRRGLEVWMVPWSWVHKVEICNDALQFHCGRRRERFSVDLETPYHLRNAIPQHIPVRIVREIAVSQRRALDTKVGLAMVAGVMFALGSGFSLLNNVMNRQQIDARANPLAASRSAIQANAPNKAIAITGANAPVGAVAAPLGMTTSHEQCVKSFNNAAQPHAYATLNLVTQTLQVNFQNQQLLRMPPQQFNPTAAAVAQEVLASCQAKTISQVVVTNGLLRYQQLRSAKEGTAVTAEQGVKLF